MATYNQKNYKTLKLTNYCRKSSEGEDRQVLSLNSQKDEGENIRSYFELPKFISSYSEAKSAKLPYKRNEFSQMIKDIKSGKIDSIVCWKLDRLARNMVEGGEIIDLLSSGVLKAIFTKDKVWLPTDNVILMAVEFSQGTQYSIDLSENVKRGQRNKAKEGTPTGLASLGFLNSKQGDKGTRWWYVNEESFNKVKKLFEAFLGGNYSVRKLHKYAIEELHLTTPLRKKLGGKSISVANIYHILKNPVYAGFFYVQGKRYELTKELPRMITEKEYEKIQQMISNNRKPKNSKHKADYAGFLFDEKNKIMSQDIKFQIVCDCKFKYAFRNKNNCPNCGKNVTDLDNPKHFIQSYYYNNRKKKARLKYKSIKQETIDNYLLNFINDNLDLPLEVLEWSKKYIKELKDKEVQENLDKVKDKEKRQIEYNKKKLRIRDMYRDLLINEDEFKQDNERLDTEYKDLYQNIKSIDWMKELNSIMDLTFTIKDNIEHGDYETKRIMLTRLSSNLIWNDEILNIINTNEIEELIKGLKIAKPIISGFGNQKALVEQELNDRNSELCITLRKW
ncbi:MAG: recombinase family protein [Candidatus Nomurabacteria bacterium]